MSTLPHLLILTEKLDDTFISHLTEESSTWESWNSFLNDNVSLGY